MKLRYQLMVAFFFVAVLPLAALTTYSYHSSTRAVRRAVTAESGRMAEDMENRMASVTADLSRSIDQLKVIPSPGGGGTGEGANGSPGGEYVGRLLSTLGGAAAYLDSVEISPLGERIEDERAHEDADRDEGGDAPSHPPKNVPHPAGRPVPSLAPPPVVIELPRFLREIEKEARAQSPKAGEKEGEEVTIGREEVGRLVSELTRQFDQGARTVANVWQIRLRAERGQERPQRGRQGARDEAELRLAHEFGTELRLGGRPVGRLRAQVSGNRLLREVLSRTPVVSGEIPFALDATGKLYTPDPGDLPKLNSLHLATPASEPKGKPDEDWVVVTRQDPSTGLKFGLAHPVGESLREIRRTSLRNMIYGMGMSLLALLGILPLSRRMTRNLTDVSRGAERLAAGDLEAQVPVRSRDEFGQLARAFNQMAGHLKENQERLIEQERLRKELEMCRKIQNELLPRAPMHSSFAEVQGVSIPARELGGDFFNYFDLPGAEIALLMGDVSGKGVPAALLMANLQATLRARLPVEPDLASFADKLDREVEQGTDVHLYLTLFVSVLDPARGELRYVNAGHQSPFVLKKGGRLDRLDPTGRPIGLLSGAGYLERRVPIEPGDTLFLYTDGLVDAENAAGESFDMDRLTSVLSRAAGEGADTILARVEAALLAFRGGVEAGDDAAMMVLRVGNPSGTSRG